MPNTVLGTHGAGGHLWKLVMIEGQMARLNGTADANATAVAKVMALPNRHSRDIGRQAHAGRGAPPSQMAKLPADLRSLARAHTAMGVKVLAGIAQNGTSDAARVSAVALLFERGWGKAPQSHTDEDASPIVVEIVQRVREGNNAQGHSCAKLPPPPPA